MIDKIQPRKLDKDSDLRLVQKNSMVDALNVYIDESNTADGDGQGSAGVLKPIKGTTEITFSISEEEPIVYDESEVEVIDSSWRVLGGVVDDATGVYYFFAWNDTDSSLQGVYAYDPDNILPGDASEGGLRRIFTTDLFNFPPNGFVKGSVVYTRPKNRQTGSNLPDNDVILYFTDNVNEPRKLNVYRCLQSSDPSGYNDHNKNDFICACPKVPMGNVLFEFAADPTREVSNFENTPGFQFAIQGVYYDGSVTAIGPYSDLAMPPSIVNRGAASKSNILSHNLCRITIPELTAEVEKVKILARTGNSANFIEVDEVLNEGSDNPNWINDGTDRYYKFYNDKVSLGVSPTEVSKTFDSVPRRAQAQTAASNRLVYGNFKEGYDPHRPDVITSVLFKKRPSEGVDFTIDFIPSIESTHSYQSESPIVGGSPYIYGNRSMGFEIDVSQIPDEIPADTKISVSLSFSPRKNFHIYQAEESYHQSRHLGPISGDYRGFRREDNIGDGDDVDLVNGNELYAPPAEGPAGQMINDGYGTPGWATGISSGGDFFEGTYGYLSDQTKTRCNAMFGQNYGVAHKRPSSAGSANFGYGSDSETKDPPRWINSSAQGTLIGTYGTSAGAPLILQGGKLTFSCEFTITQDISNGKVVVSRSLREILAKKKQDGLTYADVVEINSSITTHKHSYDLQLSNGTKIYNEDGLSDLITAVTNVSASSDGDSLCDTYKITTLTPGEGQGRIPAGYFIVNKAEVDFYLEESYWREGTSNNYKEGIYLAIADVRLPDADNSLFTCFKRPEPTAPWVCYSNATMLEAISDGSTETLVKQYANTLDLKDRYLRIGDPAEDFKNSIELIVEKLEANSPTSTITVNKHALGGFKCLETGHGNGKKFWPCTIDVDADDYTPGAKFRFSIMDGEGGPGGESPGVNSAFEKYQNGRYGSIAGQCTAVFYGDQGPESEIVNLRKAIMRAVPHVGYGFNSAHGSINDNLRGANEEAATTEVVVFGTIYDGSVSATGSSGWFGSNGTATTSNSRTAFSKIPTREDINGGSSNVCDIVYVANGPFYTGSIAMNPLVINTETIITNVGDPFPDLHGNYDNEEVLPAYQFLNGALSPDGINDATPWLPPVYDQTTTLPYIFSQSTREAVRLLQTTFAATFPFPVLDSGALIPPDGDPIVYNAYEQEDSGLYADLYDLGNMDGYNTNHPTFGSISFKGKLPHPEITSVGTSVSGVSGGTIRSFKANANHEFGVIYYDERGRHSAVNPVASVYVPGFAPSERNGISDGGPAHILMRFRSAPPDWARYYKIAYSKNTSISEFFQYSAGGAYVIPSENAIDQNLDSAKVYISLNYLQGSPVSYSTSWGARSQDGSPVVFQPKEGDKVRVISYQRPTGNTLEKIYPKGIVFDVAGIESLVADQDNPLVTQGEIDTAIPGSKGGLFLVVKNNPSNSGFSYSDISSDSHFWNNNCIIEIYRPVKDLEAEKRLFYEIGPTYLVKKDDDGNKYHANHNNSNDPIEITQGDVYFRKTAVNMREFEGGEFVDILGSIDQVNADDPSEGNEWISNSEPNFKSVYTEASSASDLFKSDAQSIGRPNKVDSNEMEYDRVSSLIHSDRDIAKDSKLGYSSFNRSTVIDRDMDVVHGEIRYIENTDDSIMVIQRDKVGHIPVDRNLISTADNEPSLIASSKFLGTARYYAGKAGCDNNPESVVFVDGNAYFTHRGDGKVYRASGANGVMDISAKGMKTFFRDLFRSADQSARIIGGFDPKKDEYLLTITEPQPADAHGAPVFEVPNIDIPSDFLANSSQTDTTVEQPPVVDNGGGGNPGNSSGGDNQTGFGGE